MPDAVAPGVYVEEAPAGARAIAGVPTSTAAFLGATQTGPVAAPLLVHSFAEFEAQFGGLAAELPLSYAVQQYFRERRPRRVDRSHRAERLDAHRC
jgi:uncharacterized protein